MEDLWKGGRLFKESDEECRRLKKRDRDPLEKRDR